MSTFRSYLWKEWREQRAAVLALAGMLPMLVLAITFGIKARQVLVPFSGLVALVVTLLAIGGELLGSDRRAGGQWLERLPAGLSGAFPAKLVLLVLTSVLALGYGTALAALGAFLRGRPVPLALPDEARVPALVVLGAAALLVTWTFAASAWSGRGMIALLVGGGVLASFALVVRHFAQLHYSPTPLELGVVTLLLVASGLASAWTAFVKGQRLGRGTLATAAHGLPTGLLCLLPVGGWTFYQLQDRRTLDLRSPDCRIHGAWVSGDGSAALFFARQRSERWDCISSRVVRADLDQGTFEVLGSPGADVEWVWNELGREPMQEPDLIRVHEGLETIAELDWVSGKLQSGGSPPRGDVQEFWRAGHGFSLVDQRSGKQTLIDPYRRSTLTREPGEGWGNVYIGPTMWLVNDQLQWFEYSPESCELSRANWMDSVFHAVGPMLADGRLLVLLWDSFTLALADPLADTLERLRWADGSEAAPEFVQCAWLRPGEPALVDTEAGRYRLDEDCMELVPADSSYDGRFVRWIPDGSLFFWMDDGLYRRAPSGERTCVFSFPNAEVAP